MFGMPFHQLFRFAVVLKGCAHKCTQMSFLGLSDSDHNSRNCGFHDYEYYHDQGVPYKAVARHYFFKKTKPTIKKCNLEITRVNVIRVHRYIVECF